MRSSPDVLSSLLIMSWGVFFAPTWSRDGVRKDAAAMNRDPGAAIGRSRPRVPQPQPQEKT